MSYKRQHSCKSSVPMAILQDQRATNVTRNLQQLARLETVAPLQGIGAEAAAFSDEAPRTLAR